MKGAHRQEAKGKQEELDLVERTIKEVAAKRDMDLALLARLDRLRTEIRQALRPRSKGRQA